MEKILSINIIKSQNNINENINPSNYPILFYWNGTTKIEKELKTNKEFTEYIFDKIINIDNYSYTKLYIIDYDLTEEKYDQKIIDIQNLYNLKDNNYTDLAYQYIYMIFNNLYRISIKKKYNPTNNDILIDDIIEIYSILKSKYNERISQETLKQYTISQLQQEYKLHQDNINYIIDIFNNIFN